MKQMATEAMAISQSSAVSRMPADCIRFVTAARPAAAGPVVGCYNRVRVARPVWKRRSHCGHCQR